MSKGNSHLPYYGPEYQILLHEGASIAAMQVMKIYFTYVLVSLAPDTTTNLLVRK
jgi:hypothetical protein